MCSLWCSGEDEGNHGDCRQEEGGQAGGTAEEQQSGPEHGQDEVHARHWLHFHCSTGHAQYHVSPAPPLPQVIMTECKTTVTVIAPQVVSCSEIDPEHNL